MTDAEIKALAEECIINMVHSMLTWNEDLMFIFHRLYTDKFCVQCGKKYSYYQGYKEPCNCQDPDFSC
jgi:hypothetical protein